MKQPHNRNIVQRSLAVLVRTVRTCAGRRNAIPPVHLEVVRSGRGQGEIEAVYKLYSLDIKGRCLTVKCKSRLLHKHCPVCTCCVYVKV
eukprot:g13700.t1